MNFVQYLCVVRALPGYNTVQFPHCVCDSRKDNGHVILVVNYETIVLEACTDKGQLEVSVTSFDRDIGAIRITNVPLCPLQFLCYYPTCRINKSPSTGGRSHRIVY